MGLRKIKGGVTAARGFSAAAVKAEIKYPNRLDLAIVSSDRPAAVAGVFTTNRIQAAPVKICRACVARGKARAIVVNSGCANACTGPQGAAAARRMAACAAGELGIPVQETLVCSTGTIGIQMPMDRVEPGIAAAAKKLSPKNGDLAARAIMTTDTRDKQVAVEFAVGGKKVRFGGMAKGAGMISPNMATMLGFLTTDAAVRQSDMQALLKAAAERSFNRITVDGDQSTNDTLLLLANGAAGNAVLHRGHKSWVIFEEAVMTVTRELAMMIVRDGEGATKFVTVTVSGAKNDSDARKASRAVAQSLLVKTSWFGCDPNWGRVIAAVGYSGAAVDQDKVDISYDGFRAVRGGVKANDFSLKDLERVLRQPSFSIDVNLHIGRGTDTIYTCDCSDGYVKINAEYMT